MDTSAAYQLLYGSHEASRLNFELAQGRFTASLTAADGGWWGISDISAWNHLRHIDRHMMDGVKNMREPLIGVLVQTIEDDLDALGPEQAHIFEKIRQRYKLCMSPPYELFEERERLRRQGAIRGSGLDREGYLEHLQLVFDNEAAIARYQQDALGLETVYGSKLAEFTPDVHEMGYRDLIETLFNESVTARSSRLENQPDNNFAPLPSLTYEQGKRLVQLVEQLWPIKEAGYKTVLLRDGPSLCMHKTATVGFDEDPLVLLASAMHERIGHLPYRVHSDNTGGINGFHMDEARALSIERFFMPETEILAQLSPLLVQAYGMQHDGFAPYNLKRRIDHVSRALSPRASADNAGYMIQECIRGRTEMYVMNGDLKVKDMPEFMAEEVKRAYNLENVPDGLRLVRQTFQWMLAMQGHISAYPAGLVLAAQLHEGIKRHLGDDWHDIGGGAKSPYFKFMTDHIDTFGTTKSSRNIIEKITGEKFLDMTALRKGALNSDNKTKDRHQGIEKNVSFNHEQPCAMQ